jgi:hypothetical protein
VAVSSSMRELSASHSTARRWAQGTAQRALVDKFDAARAEVAAHSRARDGFTTVDPGLSPATTGNASTQRVLQGKSLPRTQAAAVDPCQPVGTEQWFAKYGGGALATTPTNTSTGSARVTLTNLGSQTWPSGQSYLGYHPRSSNCWRALSSNRNHPATTRTGATGDAVTKPDHAGSTNAPDSTGTTSWIGSNWGCRTNCVRATLARVRRRSRPRWPGAASSSPRLCS